MKVLKSGKWSAEYKCTGDVLLRGRWVMPFKGCGASLLVEEKDLRRTYDYKPYFNCPECRVKTEVTGYTGDVYSLPR